MQVVKAAFVQWECKKLGPSPWVEKIPGERLATTLVFLLGISWTEELERVQSMESQKLDITEAT